MNVLQLSQRAGETRLHDGRIHVIDVYDLDATDLEGYTGVLVDGGCDQRFLASRSERLSAWVRTGGRVVANGHPVLRWLEGLPAHRKLDFHTLGDLWLCELGEHPIWAGIDRRDLLLRTGVPGDHSFDELQRIGVAGFYAHAYLVDLPQGAVPITGIGPGRLPVDVSYPLGDGEVVLHVGNDLSGFATRGTSTAGLWERMLEYLEGR